MDLNGVRLMARLQQLGKTKAWLSRELGVSGPMITYWVKGERRATKERLNQMSELLQCDLKWLVERDQASQTQGA